MSVLSNWLAKKLLDHALGVSAFQMPSQLYLGLFTSDPTDDGTGTEVSGGGYARQPVDFSASQTITDPADALNKIAQSENAGDVVFPIASASWGTVTHIALFDAATAGNFYLHCPVKTPKAVNVDERYTAYDQNLKVSMD